MEPTYPRTKPRPSASWLVDILAATLAAGAIGIPLWFLIKPRLLFSATALIRPQRYHYYYFEPSSTPMVWWWIDIALVAAFCLLVYVRTWRRTSGQPGLSFKRFAWLTLGMTLIGVGIPILLTLLAVSIDRS